MAFLQIQCALPPHNHTQTFPIYTPGEEVSRRYVQVTSGKKYDPFGGGESERKERERERERERDRQTDRQTKREGQRERGTEREKVERGKRERERGGEGRERERLNMEKNTQKMKGIIT